MMRSHHRPKLLFCYALVRTPVEPTAHLLGRQFASACDGWAFFSDADDSSENVIKAFTKEDIRKAWSHQMREMVTAGVWKHLSSVGALHEFEWFLKVDADSFVRPSTLRKAFLDLSTTSSGIISASDSASDTMVDGFFVAIRADTAIKIKSQHWPKRCDSTLSGHDEEAGFVDPVIECMQALNISHVGMLQDSFGRTLVARDQDSQDSHSEDPGGPEEYGPVECEHVGELLLLNVQENVEGPLCSCTFGAAARPACLSEEFVTIHAVKSAEIYARLVKAFP